MGRRGGTTHRRQNLQQPIGVDVDRVSGKRVHLTGGRSGIAGGEAEQGLPEVSSGHSSGWPECQAREGPNMERSFSDPVLLPKSKPDGGYWQDGWVQAKTGQN